MKTKPHIYLIGGWASDANAWQPVVERLNGDSLPCEVVEWQRALRDSVELDRRLAEPSILVGWSLGGMLALEAALRQPNQVAGLALIATTARMFQEDDYPGVNPRLTRGMKLKLRSDREGVLRDFAQLCFTDATSEQPGDLQMAETYLQQSDAHDDATLTAGLNYLLKIDLRDSLDKITCPCEVLHARGDAVIPYSQAEYLAVHLPNATLDLLDTGTHALPILDPEATAAAIRTLCEGGPHA